MPVGTLLLSVLPLSVPTTLLRAQNSVAAAPSQSSRGASAPSPGSSSEGATSKGPQGIRVRVEAVNVPVSVLNKSGLPVIGLERKDFEIYENGKQQTIRYFGKDPPVPLRIGLILDTSNSARPQLQFEKDAASEFVFNTLRGRNSRNQIFLQTYDATSSLVQDFVNDPETLNEKIRGLKAGGGKALYDAIYFACSEKLLKAGSPDHTRRVLVLMADGGDVQSTHTLDEALSMAHKAGTFIYAIGNAAYGYYNAGDKVLEKLAAATGGATFFPLRAAVGTDLLTGYLSQGQIGETSQNKGLGAATGIYSATRWIRLADSLDAIRRELDEQYTIGYTPTNNVMDGTYRTIHVVALRKGVRVRAKPGYFATAE